MMALPSTESVESSAAGNVSSAATSCHATQCKVAVTTTSNTTGTQSADGYEHNDVPTPKVPGDDRFPHGDPRLCQCLFISGFFLLSDLVVRGVWGADVVWRYGDGCTYGRECRVEL